MLFSQTGEIGLILIGLIWAINKWFDSFIDLMDLIKNNNELDDENKEIPESVKHMYS